MPRNYIINKSTGGAFGEKIKSLPRGLKVIHIGNNVWRIGKATNKNRVDHQVIYGPDNKEYHLGKEEILFIGGRWLDLIKGRDYDYFNEYGFNRDGNPACQSSFKIYVLTHILDKRENWCFDLKSIPSNGKLKVIYDNGTIKNVDFDGSFKKELISQKAAIGTRWETTLKSKREIIPVAYRKSNI